MLKRKIIKVLENWKSKHNKKALLIMGARQVGKTTTIRAFGKANYKNFVEINFEMMPLAKEAFKGNLDARTIILNLSSMGYGPFEEGKTLIFFDEIQSCPNARTSIKFLVEDGSYDFIESGSLLGLNYKDISSYPVGFEQQVEMFPLDFEEFLWANNIGEDVIEQLKTCYTSQKQVPDFLHQRITEILRKYIIVGGMPEAVNTFINDDDLSSTLQIQTNILKSYRDDISKYAGTQKAIAKSVFDAIPAQLSKEDKKFVISQVEQGASMRKYGAPTQWLADAGIVYMAYNTGSLELPFALYEKRNKFKLYMHDVGLLCNQLLPKMQFAVLNGDLFINEGALMENFVACELKRHEVSLNYYDRKSKQELDFVFPENNEISIIEVKSGKSFKNHSSLDAALANFSANIGNTIVLCPDNVEKDGEIIYLPLYMAMFVETI